MRRWVDRGDVRARWADRSDVRRWVDKGDARHGWIEAMYGRRGGWIVAM